MIKNKLMYELNDASNDSKVYINLYNIHLQNKINQIRNERNSLDSKLSKYSLNSKQMTNHSENSYKRIQKVKNITSFKENNENKNKNSISFKGSSFPICLSSMTNTNNYINSINKKFRLKNVQNFAYFKSVSDNNRYKQNINTISENKNRGKNIAILKLINNKTRDAKKILSRINFNLKKRKIFFDDNKNNNINSSMSNKNYNYFLGTTDRSSNISEKKEKKQQIKDKDKFKNIKINDIVNSKRNYNQLLHNVNLKLNLPKKRLPYIIKKKINTDLNVLFDTNINSIINKETTINDSKRSLKLNFSSNILIPKIELKTEKKEKDEEKKLEKNSEIKNNLGIGDLRLQKYLMIKAEII